jgi:hypothetical protein
VTVPSCLESDGELLGLRSAALSACLQALDAGIERYHAAMAKTITLRLSDVQYDLVKRYADDDRQSMNAWIESLVDVEDMRRRCAAHGQWMANSPETVALAEAWADQNLEALPRR